MQWKSLNNLEPNVRGLCFFFFFQKPSTVCTSWPLYLSTLWHMLHFWGMVVVWLREFCAERNSEGIQLQQTQAQYHLPLLAPPHLLACFVELHNIATSPTTCILWNFVGRGRHRILSCFFFPYGELWLNSFKSSWIFFCHKKLLVKYWQVNKKGYNKIFCW